MFISEKIIYIQMHKTASTHIASLLSELLGGKQVGKHNAASPELINSGSSFLASIRNPWDWYLSLWTYGVQGEGALRRQLCEKKLQYTLDLAIANPKENFLAAVNELFKPVTKWRSVYDNADNIDSFRRWLKEIHDPGNSRWLGEGYGRTAITGFCGFMTYRYLYLCTDGAHKLKDSRTTSSYSALEQYERASCYIDYFIRQESLEEDLCAAIEKIRPLPPEAKDRIYQAKRSNPSSRPRTIDAYYNEELIDLVSNREKLIIEKFHYLPPAGT